MLENTNPIIEKPSPVVEKAIRESKLKSVRELLEVLPVEVVYTLIYHFGGCSITPPKIDSFINLERNEKIKAGFFAGKTIKELAKEYNLASRQIQNILNKH